MEKKLHIAARDGRSDPLQLKGLAGPLLVTVFLWAIVGAIATPIMVRYFGMSPDHASAALLVVLGSLTIVTRVIDALLARWNPPKPPSEPSEISARTKVLIWLTAFSMMCAFLAIAATLAYASFLVLRFDWAVETMASITLGLVVGCLSSFLAVPFLVFGYWVISQADHLQDAINQKMALSFTMAACMIAVPLHTLHQHQIGARSPVALVRH